MTIHTRRGFIVVTQEGIPKLSSFNEDSEMSRAKIELRTRQTWESLVILGGYSIKPCEVKIEVEGA